LSDAVVERLLRAGAWRRVAAGIYALEPDSFPQRAWAGYLIGGPRAVVGRQAAAFLHGLISVAPKRVTVFVGQATRARRDDPRWQFVRGDRTGCGDLPTTSPAQTLIDLAPQLDRHELATVVSRALATRLVQADQMTALLQGQRQASGRRLLLDLLGGPADGLESPLESRYEHDVERAHGLPRMTRQASLTGRDRCDGLYEAYRLIVELDGLAYHLDKLADMERDNRHLVLGYRTLRFGWAHVTRQPCAVAAQVAAALRQGGWPGTLRPCPRCPRPA
jgi:very-short-patch-repair endonuclease